MRAVVVVLTALVLASPASAQEAGLLEQAATALRSNPVRHLT
jgi:hypothetical protein